MHKGLLRRFVDEFEQETGVAVVPRKRQADELVAEEVLPELALSWPISVRKPSWPIGASMICTGRRPAGPREFMGLGGEVKPVRVHGRHQELCGGRGQGLGEATAPPADVVAHEGFGDGDVAVRVETPDQFAALVVQVALHLVAAAPGQRSGFQGASESWAFRPNRPSSSAAER